MLFMYGELNIIVAGGKYEYVSYLTIFFITMKKLDVSVRTGPTIRIPMNKTKQQM